MKYELHTLKNGLRVVLVPIKDTQTATVVIMVGTGSRYESKKENGLAHFLEHMFFKGTKKRPSAKAIAEELDAMGARNNAFTAKNRTAYYAKADFAHVDNILDVISDMFLNSTLPQKEINKERGTIVQEINMYEDMPMRTIYEVFDALLFGDNHPLGRDILGPKKNILSFTRKNFKDYLNRAYVAENSVVCVAGKFSKQKVLSKIREDFSHMPTGKIPNFETKMITQMRQQVAIKHKKTDQTHIILGVPSYELGHKDEFALVVLAAILGQGMSSRLFTEVREKRGLAYSVRSFVESYVDIGYFATYAGVEHKNLESAVRTILTELQKIKNKLISAKELKKAKEFTKGQMALSLDTTDALAFAVAESLILRDKVYTPDKTRMKIDAVKASDIKRVAKDIFKTSKLNLAIIGPHTKKARFEKILTL